MTGTCVLNLIKQVLSVGLLGSKLVMFTRLVLQSLQNRLQ